MGAQENVDLIRRLYDAFDRGDADTVNATFADDVVWHEGGIHQLAGDYHGVGGVMEVNGRAAELSGGTLGVDVHDVLGSDDHVVILQRVSLERNGERHELDEALIVHVAGGRVTEVWVAYPDPAAAARAFG